MDDALEDNQANMAVENYEAIMKVKYHLRANSVKSTAMPVSASMRRNILASRSTYGTFLQEKKARAEATCVWKCQVAKRKLLEL